MVSGATGAGVPRLVVAGTASGTGKTTVATGLMAALGSRRGLRVAGFKVGPDFIDPSYHALATGRPGRNLDAWLSGPELVAPLFAHGAAGADVAVVEGVMGLFDGASGPHPELASTAQVAKLLGAPVVLVVDAHGLGRSVAALVGGYASFDPALRVAAVIANRVGSERHADLLREALGQVGVPLLGAVGRDDAIATPSRHLGLVPAAERAAEARRTVAAAGERVAAACDLDALLALARSAGPLAAAAWTPRAAPASAQAPGGPPDGGAAAHPAERASAGGPSRPVVAVAAGPAFTFAYQENLELLAAAGADLAGFDPTAEERLPEGTAALHLGGGFPEAHADALSANARLRAEIAAFAASGRPVTAECGGLLYLARRLDGLPMCAVLDADAELRPRLTLGYRQARAAAGSVLWAAGAGVRGHEFHHSAVDPAAGDPPAWRLEPGRDEGWVAGGVHASYLHTHWAATPHAAARLVAAARAAAPVPRERGGGR
ncbi:MAG TPA: cobyrinate a,c-diamide synthase [Actinomycetes bacterium]|nr:cobyrinate a,c-diamide synthase [Actinomycetes bacterium]